MHSWSPKGATAGEEEEETREGQREQERERERERRTHTKSLEPPKAPLQMGGLLAGGPYLPLHPGKERETDTGTLRGRGRGPCVWRRLRQGHCWSQVAFQGCVGHVPIRTCVLAIRSMTS